MQRFHRRNLDGLADRNSGAVFGDLHFSQCVFDDCVLSATDDPSLRSTIRNVRLDDCSVRSVAIFAAAVEDTVISNLKTRGLLQTWGTVFSRVTLQGKIGRLMLSSRLGGLISDETQRTFDQANQEYYRHVDWALDISQARFHELDIRGIPARLIRRDPRTQVVITRERAMQGIWRQHRFKSLAAAYIKGLLYEGHADVVVVVPRLWPLSWGFAHDLARLRELGVAEPD